VKGDINSHLVRIKKNYELHTEHHNTDPQVLQVEQTSHKHYVEVLSHHPTISYTITFTTVNTQHPGS